MNENYLSRVEICIYSPLPPHCGPLLFPTKKQMKTRSTTFNAVCCIGSNNNCSCEKLIENLLTENNNSGLVFSHISSSASIFLTFITLVLVFIWWLHFDLHASLCILQLEPCICFLILCIWVMAPPSLATLRLVTHSRKEVGSWNPGYRSVFSKDQEN